MDVVIRQLMKEFCAERGMDSAHESEQFEAFTTHCVLSEHVVGPFDAADFRVGGGADGGIDGYAVVVNDRPYRRPEDVANLLERASDVSPTIVVIQAKTSSKMDRKFISELRIRVENILRTELDLDNATAVEPLRQCLRVLHKNIARLSRRGVRLHVVYANTSPRANREMRQEAARAEESLSRIGIVGDVEFECLGRDDLNRLYERASWPGEAQFSFIGHYAMPAVPGVSQLRQGVVPAGELVTALSDGSGALDQGLFTENIREYLPDAQVNDEIRATLSDDEQRRRFAVLNNGVTIVARQLRAWADSRVAIRDFQVVNGCQTCNVLAEESDRLDDVSVKVQIIECDDDDLINEIVTATNRQTSIPRGYFINRYRLMRRLEIHYREQRDRDRPLYFERKPTTAVPRGHVIGMNRQLRAHVAMFGRLPPSSGYRELDRVFHDLFDNASVAEFYTAAAALYRWDWLVSTKRVAKRYGPLGYQAIAVAGVVYGVRPLRGSHNDRLNRLARLEEITWADGQWELLGIDIQAVLDDALARLDFPEPRKAAASQTFGQTVVRLASELPRR